MLRILHSEESDNALHEIFLYTAKEWGITQARKYHESLSDVFYKLAENPNLGVKNQYIPSIYKAYHIGRHIIVYRSTNLELFIIAILHESMDIEKRLEKIIRKKKR